MNLNEKQLEKEYIFKGRVINLRRDLALLPDGNKAYREVIEHNGGVCVAAIDEEGYVYTVRQFRYPYGEVITEIPAGKRDSRDEDPLECGKRELREETGLTADNYYFLGKLYPTPGYCGEIIWMYAATSLHQGENDLDSDEFLNVEKIKLDKLVSMILCGEITDAKTQAAVLKLKILTDCKEIDLHL